MQSFLSALASPTNYFRSYAAIQTFIVSADRSLDEAEPDLKRLKSTRHNHFYDLNPASRARSQYDTISLVRRLHLSYESCHRIRFAHRLP